MVEARRRPRCGGGRWELGWCPRRSGGPPVVGRTCVRVFFLLLISFAVRPQCRCMAKSSQIRRPLSQTTVPLGYFFSLCVWQKAHGKVHCRANMCRAAFTVRFFKFAVHPKHTVIAGFPIVEERFDVALARSLIYGLSYSTCSSISSCKKCKICMLIYHKGNPSECLHAKKNLSFVGHFGIFSILSYFYPLWSQIQKW
jgi:hypothetical protein